MADRAIHDQASEANVERVEGGGNSVHIQGPDSVEVLLTPKAALETARRIGDAAVDALLDGGEKGNKKGSHQGPLS